MDISVFAVVVFKEYIAKQVMYVTQYDQDSVNYHTLPNNNKSTHFCFNFTIINESDSR